MPLRKIRALGWENVIQLSNGLAEVLITLDVGPRILSYKLNDSRNVLRVFDEQMGKSGEDLFTVRGGHRIWISPETDHTYAPDNSPVHWAEEGPVGVTLETPSQKQFPIRKQLSVSLGYDSTAVTVHHRATNDGIEPITTATWGLTVMAPGGWHIIPQPALGVHGKDFLPNRVVVPWTYTDFSDDRWRFGRRFWTLTPRKGGPPTKMGFALRDGWVAYLLDDQLFIKTIEFEEGETYPDLGCNYETFSKSDFIELESLSPLKELQPGESIGHTETWHLFGDITAPNAIDEAALEHWLHPYLAKTGHA